MTAYTGKPIWTGSVLIKILAVITATWTLLELANYFVEDLPLAKYRWLGLSIFVTGAIISALLWELVTLDRRHRSTAAALKRALEEAANPTTLLVPEREDVGYAMLKVVRAAYTARNWEEVVKLGNALSRPLWLTGRYELRLEIGKLLESAAAFGQKADVQAAALIDDLGWTNAAFERFADASRNIEHGLALAETIQRHDLTCKAHRHLAAIAAKQGRFHEAELQIQAADRALARVKDRKVRNELAAQLAYQRGRVLHSKGDFQGALTELDEAESMFERLGDTDRTVKVMAAKAQAYLGAGDLPMAKDIFRKGLTAARRQSRRDSEMRNLIGLADVADNEGHRIDAKALLLEASEIAKALGDASKAAALANRAMSLNP